MCAERALFIPMTEMECGFGLVLHVIHWALGVWSLKWS